MPLASLQPSFVSRARLWSDLAHLTFVRPDLDPRAIIVTAFG